MSRFTFRKFKAKNRKQRALPNSEAVMKQLRAEPGLMEDFTKQFGEQIMAQLAKKMMGA